jgi:hypothetical protein
MIQLKTRTLLIVVAIAIIATVLVVNTFSNHAAGYDPSAVDSLKKMEVRLLEQNKKLASLLTQQSVQDEENRKFDSSLQAQYENAVNENEILLQKLNDQKNEKIKRINSFGSDSLRRAFAND